MNTDPIQRLADELAILRVLARLAQSVDDRDEARYRACLANEVMVPAPDGEPGGWLAVPGQDYARRSIEAASDMAWTHHKLCNPVIDLAGDRASAKADVVVDLETAGGEGRRERLTIGGRYELEFARLEDGWRISRRRLVRRYVIGDPMLADQARLGHGPETSIGRQKLTLASMRKADTDASPSRTKGRSSALEKRRRGHGVRGASLFLGREREGTEGSPLVCRD